MVLLEMNHVKKSFDGNGVLKDISLKLILRQHLIIRILLCGK